MAGESVTYRWALKRIKFNSENAKRVLASVGSTYILINKDRSPTDDIIVAFKWVDLDGKRPLPPDCQFASDEQDKRLEEITKGK